jgi:hypothetical protein
VSKAFIVGVEGSFGTLSIFPGASTLSDVHRLSSWLCLFLLVMTVHAQVDVKLEFDQNKFLTGETSEVILRISNFTGAPLRLGERPDWLRFSVENVSGVGVARIADLEHTGAFTLKTGARATLRFDLTPLFKIDQVGRYNVSATVYTGSGEDHVITAPAEFEVMTGVVLWEREFGLSGGVAERRRYAIVQANYLKRARIFAAITNPEASVTYKVISLGTVVSFNPPSMAMDAQNRLHVLHQYGADEFLHHRIHSDGTVALRHTYVSRVGRPMLGVDGTGDVAVVRATRRPSKQDISLPDDSGGSGTNGVATASSKTNSLLAPTLPPTGAPRAR